MTAEPEEMRKSGNLKLSFLSSEVSQLIVKLLASV